MKKDRYMDIMSFEKICRFLHKIDSNFVLRIACPIHNAYEHGYKIP